MITYYVQIHVTYHIENKLEICTSYTSQNMFVYALLALICT